MCQHECRGCPGAGETGPEPPEKGPEKETGRSPRKLPARARHGRGADTVTPQPPDSGRLSSCFTHGRDRWSWVIALGHEKPRACEHLPQWNRRRSAKRGGTSSRRRDSGAFTCRLDAHPHAFSIFADKKLKRGEAPSHREAQGMGLGREGIGPGDGTGQGGNRTKWKWLVTLRRGLSAGGDRERLQGGRDAWAERGCSVWPGGIFLFSCKCF